MADKLTNTQSELGGALLELAEHHRTFADNYGDAAANLRRIVIHEVAVATGAGLVVGALVGVFAGIMRRR